MRLTQQFLVFGAMIFIAVATSCKSKPDKKGDEQTPVTIKGIYTFEPGAKLFTPCGKSTQHWVVDSSAQLELQYSQQVSFEQKGLPVYVEVDGYFSNAITDTDGASYDRTLIVKKLIKITKDIPADCK
ncbi:MAG: hypothetical protein V4619_10740 [Bacteroidota bacterium]